MSASPLSLIVELTHRCPLRCAYCSNPLELARSQAELRTADWLRVIREAQELGVVQLHFTGGEPLVRNDLESLVAHAAQRGLYTNLITSGVGLTRARMTSLVASGLEHVQLSLQDADAPGADRISGAQAWAYKLEVARLVREQPVAFTINVVLHRLNLDRLESIIALAESLGPQRLELAHTQYYGWALRNRAQLMPSSAQVEQSKIVVDSARQRLGSRMVIDFVLSDYHAQFPKACMGGWAQKSMLVDPTGRALPCHAASQLPQFPPEFVQQKSLSAIWTASELFTAFRGQSWMTEECRTCDRRELDFGGCRCQAFALTGDASRTDPVCHKSLDRPLVDALLAQTPVDALGLRPVTL
ncbi:MAG: pyrroloquinoline quinone biosynthesis protein PqqE [Bdellovibrionales bacterium]|nr:pyrroloquinoline quinone biosynthesis protein PqqE [Bdellovibrionales bacterium]